MSWSRSASSCGADQEDLVPGRETQSGGTIISCHSEEERQLEEASDGIVDAFLNDIDRELTSLYHELVQAVDASSFLNDVDRELASLYHESVPAVDALPNDTTVYREPHSLRLHQESVPVEGLPNINLNREPHSRSLYKEPGLADAFLNGINRELSFLYQGLEQDGALPNDTNHREPRSLQQESVLVKELPNNTNRERH